MLVSIVRVFRMIRFQPELAIVTATIARSATDLLSFFLIFLLLLALFGAALVMFFGPNIKAFSTLASSVFTELRWVMGDLTTGELTTIGGNGELTAFFETGGPTARLMFVVFMVLMFYILMNMFLLCCSQDLLKAPFCPLPQNTTLRFATCSDEAKLGFAGLPLLQRAAPKRNDPKYRFAARNAATR